MPIPPTTITDMDEKSLSNAMGASLVSAPSLYATTVNQSFAAQYGSMFKGTVTSSNHIQHALYDLVHALRHLPFVKRADVDLSMKVPDLSYSQFVPAVESLYGDKDRLMASLFIEIPAESAAQLHEILQLGKDELRRRSQAAAAELAREKEKAMKRDITAALEKLKREDI